MGLVRLRSHKISNYVGQSSLQNFNGYFFDDIHLLAEPDEVA